VTGLSMRRPDVAPLGTATRVGTGVYAFSQPDGGWCLSNSGFVCGSERTVLIDTAATEARTLALLDAADRASTSPHRLLVNTHFHGDHTLGNSFVPTWTPILAHPAARTRMREAGLDLLRLWPEVDWGGVQVRLPDIDVDDSVTLRTGPATGSDPRVELHHLGVAHTDNDLVAWLPRERVLFAGDQVMSGSTPFLLFGSVLGSRAALDGLAALEPRVVVPGHGRIGGPALIEQTRTYLDWLVEVARSGLRERVRPLQLASRCGPGPFPSWSEPERLVANLHRAYADLQGAPPAAPLELGSVLADVASLAPGGRLVCRA
jgi:cyclase